MPIILSGTPPPTGRATLGLRADTVGQGRAQLNLRALTLRGGRASLMLRSQSVAQQGRASLTISARTAGEQGRAQLNVTATTHATQTGSSAFYLGEKTRRFGFSTTDGMKVISFDFKHGPTGRELALVAAGIVRPARNADIGLTLTDLDSNETLSIQVPWDGEYSTEQLPTGGYRTSLRGLDPQYSKLVTTRLPELIPWANNPSRDIAGPGYRSLTRQVIDVFGVLFKAFQAAGQTIYIVRNPLMGQQWEETRREYSTLGKSPLQVWQETYGLLNFELVWEGENGWRGFAPNEGRNTARISPRIILPGSESRQVLQYPTAVRVQVGDVYIARQGYLMDVANTGKLPDQVTGPGGAEVKVEIRDPQAAIMEVASDAELTGLTSNDDGTQAAYYIEKVGGRVVRSIDVTLGSQQVALELSAPPGETPRRDFRNVVLSYSETLNEYLSPTSTTLSRTRTTTQRYAYAYDVVLADLNLPAALSLGTVAVGALLGAEQSSEVYVYSHQGGHLRTKTSSEEKITAIGQAHADSTDPAQPPGVPVALESSRTVTVETYTAVGEGLWRTSVQRSHAAKVPVRDLTSGDWVKQISAPMVTVSTRISDNAPPSVSDPDIPSPGAQAGTGTPDAPMFPTPPPFEYLRNPQIQTVLLTGTADVASITLPMVEDNQGQLAQALGKLWAGELKPRTTRTIRAASALTVKPRVRLDGIGLVRSVSVSGRAGSVRTEAICEERDL